MKQLINIRIKFVVSSMSHVALCRLCHKQSYIFCVTRSVISTMSRVVLYHLCHAQRYVVTSSPISSVSHVVLYHLFHTQSYIIYVRRSAISYVCHVCKCFVVHIQNVLSEVQIITSQNLMHGGRGQRRTVFEVKTIVTAVRSAYYRTSSHGA